MAQRREGYHKVVSNLKRAIQIVHDAGWMGWKLAQPGRFDIRQQCLKR